MKIIQAIFISLLAFPSITSAQENQYYYLNAPIQNIFQDAFSKPGKRADPRPLKSEQNITEADLRVDNSYAKQQVHTNKNRDNSFLFNTWTKIKGVEITATYYNVKHVTLKESGWNKIKDNAYHVVEALRADSVRYTIRRTDTTEASTKAIAKIAALFIEGSTAVGTVLNAFSDSASDNGTIYHFRGRNNDTISFSLNDPSIYYAARYVRMGESEYGRTLFGSVLAPICSIKTAAVEYVEDSLIGNTTYNFLQTNCQVLEQDYRMQFIDDPVKRIRNVLIRKKNNDGTWNDIYDSGYIDFEDEYSKDPYFCSFQFDAGSSVTGKVVKNRIIVNEVNFYYNPKTRRIKVVNYLRKPENYFHTCVYEKTADIDFYPSIR